MKEANPIHHGQNSTPRATAELDNRWLLGIAIILLVVVVYIPAIRGNFIFDDDLHLTRNIVLTDNGLYRVWFAPGQFDYYPVTWTSYWLEYQIWGLNPTGYHMVNLLMHAACALLIWHILMRLKIPGAWVAAVIFALHPVNVESAAWIAQRKSILSMLLFLSSLLLYLRFDQEGRRRCYWMAVVLFVLAMLSKGSIVMLPVVILMCVWWMHKKISRKDIMRSIPFFMVSIVMSVVVLCFMSKVLNEEVVRGDSFLTRLATAGYALWFYLYKAILPLNLIFIYPRWQIESSNWVNFIPVAVFVGMLMLSWCCRRSWGRPVLFAVGYFAVMLVPALGFVDVYFWRYSLVADHYQYASIIGIIGLVVATGYCLADRAGRQGKDIMRVAAVSVVVAMGILSWQQSGIYKNMESLWEDTLEKNPRAWIAHNSLGFELQSQDKIDEAIAHYRKAIELEPDYILGLNNLGNALKLQGKFDEAVSYFHHALEVKPNSSKTHNNLGVTLMSQDKLDEAVVHLRRAISIKPSYIDAHYNLANALQLQGEYEQAKSHYLQVLEMNPTDAAAHNNLGSVLQSQGKLDEAIIHYRKAVELMPNSMGVRTNLARALSERRKLNK